MNEFHEAVISALRSKSKEGEEKKKDAQVIAQETIDNAMKLPAINEEWLTTVPPKKPKKKKEQE